MAKVGKRSSQVYWVDIQAEFAGYTLKPSLGKKSKFREEVKSGEEAQPGDKV